MHTAHFFAKLFFALVLAAAPILSFAANDLPSSKQLQNELQAALKVGDSKEKIESVLKDRSLRATYDKYSHRYQSIMRSPTTEAHAIVIYVNVDQERRFVYVETYDSYTAP